MTDAVRKPLGGLLLIAGLALYAIAVALLAGYVGGWHALSQALFYLVAGVAWVPAFKPLVRWIETGRFTKAAR